MSNEIWKRLPDEPVRAYDAFIKYRSLEPNGDGMNKRTIDNVRILLGRKSMSGLEQWSAKFNWVERAAAWDEKRHNDIIKLQDVDAVRYRQAVVDTLLLQLAPLDKLINSEINSALEEQAQGERVNAVTLKRLLEAVTMADNLRRRAAGMPTVFTREKSDGEEETMTFMIGELDE